MDNRNIVGLLILVKFDNGDIHEVQLTNENSWNVLNYIHSLNNRIEINPNIINFMGILNFDDRIDK